MKVKYGLRWMFIGLVLGILVGGTVVLTTK